MVRQPVVWLGTVQSPNPWSETSHPKDETPAPPWQWLHRFLDFPWSVVRSKLALKAARCSDRVTLNRLWKYCSTEHSAAWFMAECCLHVRCLIAELPKAGECPVNLVCRENRENWHWCSRSRLVYLFLGIFFVIFQVRGSAFFLKKKLFHNHFSA